MNREGPLGIPAPPVSEADAVRLVCALYGLSPDGEVRALALPGEYDANFEISAKGDRRFVLRLIP